MLVINAAAVAIGMAVFAIGAFVLNDLEFVLYALVAVIMLRSVASEIAVTKIIKKNITKDFIIELVMTIAFIVAVRFLTLWWACLAYACALINKVRSYDGRTLDEVSGCVLSDRFKYRRCFDTAVLGQLEPLIQAVIHFF